MDVKMKFPLLAMLDSLESLIFTLDIEASKSYLEQIKIQHKEFLLFSSPWENLIKIICADFPNLSPLIVDECVYNSIQYKFWLDAAKKLMVLALFDQAAYILRYLEQNAGLNTINKITYGNCLGSARKFDAALQVLNDVNPALVGTFQELEQYAMLAATCGQISRAITILDKLIDLEPRTASFYNNRACIRTKLIGYFPSCLVVKDCKIAINLASNDFEYVAAMRNLANEYKKLGNHWAAQRLFDKCYTVSKDKIYLFFRSMTELQLSNLDAGWDAYEYRLSSLTTSVFAQCESKLWSNSNFDTKYNVVCIWEQGLGDTLFSLRLLYLLTLYGINFSIYVQPPLLNLVKELLVEHDVKAVDLADVPNLINQLQDNQKILPLMSLSYFAKCKGLINLSSCSEFHGLSSDIRVQKWANWLTSLPEFSATSLKIGLIWKGNPQAEAGPLVGRSMDITLLHDILMINKCLFIPLQYATETHEIYASGYAHKFPYGCIEKIASIDILDRICLAQNLDLVITVDTMAAHYLGLYQVNTALLLHYSHDWRWGLRSHESKFYPTIKTYRQELPGCWKSPLEKLKNFINIKKNNIITQKKLVKLK